MSGATFGVHELVAAIGTKAKACGAIRDLLYSLDAARMPMWRYFCNRLDDSIAAKAVTLKVLNLILAKYHFVSRSAVLVSRPFGLLVDPSNGCNLACPGCVHSSHAKSLKLFDWNKGLLVEERFSQMLQRYGPYAIQVMFCNYGEPTTNLNTPRFIELAKSYLAQTALSTNLSIARFDAEAYVRSGLDFMYLSIDGASQPVYQMFRRNGNIDVVYRNVRSLVEAKRQLGKSTPILRWQYLAFEHNAHEIPMALEMAASLGVDQFTVETPFDVSWDYPDVRPAADVRPMSLELLGDTECKLRENWGSRRMGIAIEVIEREFEAGWARSLDAQQICDEQTSVVVSGHTCSWLYKNMVMDANGRVLPCCAAPRPDSELVFATFTDARCNCFNSELYQRARMHFAAAKTAPGDARAAGAGEPHCTHCEWDQDHTEIGRDQVAQYLRSAGAGLFEADTIDLLCNW